MYSRKRSQPLRCSHTLVKYWATSKFIFTLCPSNNDNDDNNNISGNNNPALFVCVCRCLLVWEQVVSLKSFWCHAVFQSCLITAYLINNTPELPIKKLLLRFNNKTEISLISHHSLWFSLSTLHSPSFFLFISVSSATAAGSHALLRCAPSESAPHQHHLFYNSFIMWQFLVEMIFNSKFKNVNSQPSHGFCLVSVC